MTSKGNAIQVGALDPELNSSPIMEEGDEDFDVLAQEVEDLPTFFCNNISCETRAIRL